MNERGINVFHTSAFRGLYNFSSYFSHYLIQWYFNTCPSSLLILFIEKCLSLIIRGSFLRFASEEDVIDIYYLVSIQSYLLSLGENFNKLSSYIDFTSN